jgi:manganese transport protein
MGQFANPVWLKLMAWTIVILIAGLNGYLLISQFA